MPRPATKPDRVIVPDFPHMGYAEPINGIYYTRTKGRGWQRRSSGIRAGRGAAAMVRERLRFEIICESFPELVERHYPDEHRRREHERATDAISGTPRVIEAWGQYLNEVIPKKHTKTREGVVYARKAYLPDEDMAALPMDAHAIERHLVTRDTTLSEHLKLSTRKEYLSKVSDFLRWCVRRGMLSHNPSAAVVFERDEERQIRIFTPDEYAAIAETVEQRHGRIYRLAADLIVSTGMRRNEALCVRFSDVTPDAIRILGKGRRRREFPLGPFPDVMPIIEELASRREPVNTTGHQYLLGHFWNYAGDDPKQLSRAAGRLSDTFGRSARACGVGGSLHDLRRTFIRMIETRGRITSPALHAMLLGHSPGMAEKHYKAALPALELAELIDDDRAR